MAGVDLVIIFSIPIYVVVAAIIIVLILRYYTRKNKLPWMAYITLFLTYWILFTALALIAVDLSSGLYANSVSNGASSNPPVYLIYFWQFMYWSIQVLAWIGVPLWQSYTNGEFTVIRRLLRAALENALLYTAMAIVGLIALGVLVLSIFIHNHNLPTGGTRIEITWKMLLGIGQSLSNIYGLLMLISLMGYGVVDLPRYLWQHAHKQRTLKFYEFQAVDLDEACNNSEAEMKEQLSRLLAVEQYLKDDDNLIKYVNQMKKTCQKELNSYPQLEAAHMEREELETFKKRRNLVKLHKSIIDTCGQFARNMYQYKYLQESYNFLQDVQACMNSKERRIKSLFRRPRVKWLSSLIDYPEWLYYRYFRILLYRLASIFIILFALVIIYSEFTPFILSMQIYISKDPNAAKDVSVLSLLVRWLATSRIILQIVSMCIISLMALVTLFALFRIEIYSLYKLVPHYSDAYSILYTAVFLCRIVPTLCYNFLQVTGVTEKDGVAYYAVMGVLRVDGLGQLFKTTGAFEVIAGGFTNYFPMVMILISALTLFRVVDLIARILGVKRFKFNPKVDDATILEGRGMLQSLRKEAEERIKKENPEFANFEINIEQTDLDSLELKELDMDNDSDDNLDNTTHGYKKATERRLDDLYKKHGKERAPKSEESNSGFLKMKLFK
jgi:hypothetical protein